MMIEGWLMICFFSLAVGATIGLAFAIFILLPLFLYTIPYTYWLAGQKSVGKHLDLYNGMVRKDSLFQLHNVKNATKLYAAWIRRREPTF